MATLNRKEAIAFHRNIDPTGRELDASGREKLLHRVLPKPRTTNMSVPPATKAYQPQRPTRKHSTRSRTSPRPKPIRKLISWQFHVFVYTLIQFIFGLYIRLRIAYHAISERILAILYYHHRTPELIRKDVRHLSKLPEHLSVILTLPEDASNAGLEKLVNDVAEIAAWCASAGIPALSVYERTGILKSYVPQTYATINRTLQSYFGNTPYSNCPSISLRAPNQNAYSPPTTPPSEVNGEDSPNHLPILLISEEDGRSTLVDLTKTLTEMAQKSRLAPSDISSELIDAEISESVMGEPDLLLCFGPKLVLDGYPPWQVRLTEIFCVRDNLEGVGYQVFLRALCNFAKAQMRFGR